MYSPPKAPAFDNLEQLSAWVEGELGRLADSLSETRELDLRTSFREPVRPRDGVIVFADGTEWDPGEGRGIYYFDTDWNQLAPSSAIPPAGVAWGDITGTLSDQTDLQGALDGKAALVHSHVSADITDFTEAAQDATAALIAAGVHTGITFSYNDPGGALSATVTITQYTDELAQDAIAAMFAAGSHTGITFTYSDVGNSMSAAVTITQYTDELAQDAAAAMLSAGTHTNMTFTYNDGSNSYDVAINDVFVFNSGDTMTGALITAFGTAALPGLGIGSTTQGFTGTATTITMSLAAGDTRHLYAASSSTHTNFAGAMSMIVRGITGAANIQANRWSSNANSPAFFTQKARESGGNEAVVIQNDQFFAFNGQAYDGAAYRVPFTMSAFVRAATPSSTDMESEFIMAIAAAAAVAATDFLAFRWSIGFTLLGRLFLDPNSLVQLRSTSLAGAFTGAAGKIAFFNNVGGDGAVVSHDGTRYKMLGDGGYQTIATNAAFTITPMTSPRHTRHTGTLTANRIVTLSNTNAYPGYQIWLTRTGAGAFTLDVQTSGGGALKSLATNTWALFIHDGTDFYLGAYGAL